MLIAVEQAIVPIAKELPIVPIALVMENALIVMVKEKQVGSAIVNYVQEQVYVKNAAVMEIVSRVTERVTAKIVVGIRTVNNAKEVELASIVKEKE